jgi:hypothetical protein
MAARTESIVIRAGIPDREVALGLVKAYFFHFP